MSRLLYIAAVLTMLCVPACLNAQGDDDDVSLGDLARALRNSKPPDSANVIDNDNLAPMMDKAESERLEGKPVSAISSRGTFTTVSPDGTCSLSFNARSVNPSAVAYIATDLPQDELLKLDGPAAIRDGELVVSVHNGTEWELTEVVVGITLLHAQSSPPEYRFATLDSVNARSSQKLSDPTQLYHLKGSALPLSDSVFRVSMNSNVSDTQEWHWTIVGARGIPPAAQSTLRAQTLLSPGLSSPQSSRGMQLAAPAQNSSPSDSGILTPATADQPH